MKWIERLLTGQPALALATIAVAVLGLAMMAGRLPVRRGIEVVIGIVLIFGAATIANGLSMMSSDGAQFDAPAMPIASPMSVRQPPAAPYDPYAGASVPQNRASSDFPVPMR